MRSIVNSFNWQVNNFADTWPGSTSGLTLTADGAANTKGTSTAALAGIAEDCYGMAITINVGHTDNTNRRQMIDVLIDPAAGVGNAGSSWSVLIPNLYTQSPATAGGNIGFQYYFPIYLKAGTAIGARTQDTTGGGTCRFSIRLVGKPSRPELVNVGFKVQTIGASTGTTVGTSFTPGNNAYGSWSASLGTLTADSWFWQIGVGATDASLTANTYRLDVSAVSAGGVMCMRGCIYIVTSNLEQGGKITAGEGYPIKEVPSGSNVYIRGAGFAAPDTGMSGVVYAVS